MLSVVALSVVFAFTTHSAAGNVLKIPSASRDFNYDSASYSYDGEGRCVKPETPTGTTVFAYDAAGQLAAQYGPNSETGPQYVTQDHLGSTRLITTAASTPGGMPVVYKDSDYLPFGQELKAGAGGAARGATFDGGGNRVKFTGKERDAETGLDYFEARYLSSAQGRFTSPDPGNAGAFPSNPQSWNAYSYVVNNPLKYTDPHGLSYQVCDADGKNCGPISDAEFERFRSNNKDLNFRGGSSGSIFSGKTKSGTFRQTDIDLTSPAFLALASGTQQAAPVVNTAAAITVGFVAVATGAEIAAAVAETGVTLIPGLAPASEYTGAIRTLDALGKANPGATISATQARALAQNVVDVLRVTAVAAATKGGPYVESLRRQLENPRFAFLNQIPGPLKEELVQAAAKVGITVK